ncbi:MAG TPA: HAMP domain-containing protein, partial [Intrasporangium sp.]|nr:HAMP domain-containing protein [Intrasporangium sp.]
MSGVEKDSSSGGRGGLATRLMVAQVLVLGASVVTAGAVAAIVGPPLFHQHLLEAGQVPDSPQLAHIEQAYRDASLVSLGFAVVIALVCAGAVTWYVTRRLQAPLGALANAAREVSRGHLGARVGPLGAGTEFDELGHAFNLMAS